MWLNVSLEPDKAHFSLNKEKLLSQIDVVAKGALPTGFALTLFFDACENTSGELPLQPSPALSVVPERRATSSRDVVHAFS